MAFKITVPCLLVFISTELWPIVFPCMILKTRSGLDISPVFNASAVLVLSFVGVIFQELVPKITVRDVQFNPAEFSFLGVASCVGILLGNCAEIFYCHRRNVPRFSRESMEMPVTSRSCAWTGDRLSSLLLEIVSRMRHTTDVPC